MSATEGAQWAVLNDQNAPELPERRWGLVSTDSITNLPRTERGFDDITS